MFGGHLDVKSKMAAKITSWICGIPRFWPMWYRDWSNTSNPTNFRAMNPFLVLKLCFCHCLLGRVGGILMPNPRWPPKITSIPQVHIGLREEWCLQGFQMHCGIVSCLLDWVISNQCRWWFSIGLRKGVCIIQDDDRRPSCFFGFLRCVTETWVIPRTSLTVGREICFWR